MEVLEEDEKSRQGMFDAKEWLRRQRQEEKHVPKKKKVVKEEDMTRIANKVTHSIASQIDKMVKNKQKVNCGDFYGNNRLPYQRTPYNILNPPFHNVNNPFWSKLKKQKCLQSRRVTNSIAAHIDRMVKYKENTNGGKIHGNYSSPYPPNTYNIHNPPFHNVNNPFWSKVKKQRCIQNDPYCPSCKRSYVTTKPAHKPPKRKTKKAKKKTKEIKEKKVKKKVKEMAGVMLQSKPSPETLVSVDRPLIKLPSRNILAENISPDDPKKIWAKELLEEFRVQAEKNEQKKKEAPSRKPVEKEHQKKPIKTHGSKTKSSSVSKKSIKTNQHRSGKLA